MSNRLQTEFWLQIDGDRPLVFPKSPEREEEEYGQQHVAYSSDRTQVTVYLTQHDLFALLEGMQGRVVECLIGAGLIKWKNVAIDKAKGVYEFAVRMLTRTAVALGIIEEQGTLALAW